MRFLVLFSLLTNLAVAAEKAPKKVLPTKAMAKKAQSKIIQKKEEDCDDKAKKIIEIKEESISLSGNTGCSLDDVKH